MYDTSRTSFGPAEILKLPSMSATTPVDVPLILMVAPTNGPVASLTLPVTVIFCCTAMAVLAPAFSGGVASDTAKALEAVQAIPSASTIPLRFCLDLK